MTRTLTLDEAAAVLKCHTDMVSTMIRREGLPAVKIGRAWVLIEEDVIAWLRTRYHLPPEPAGRPEHTTCASTAAADLRRYAAGLVSYCAALRLRLVVWP